MARKIYVPTSILRDLLYDGSVAVYKDGNITGESYSMEEEIYDYDSCVKDGVSSTSITKTYTFDDFNFSISYTEYSVGWDEEIYANEVELSKDDIDKLVEQGNIFIFEYGSEDISIEDLVWEKHFYALDEISNTAMISEEKLLEFLLSKYNLTDKQAREMYIEENK